MATINWFDEKVLGLAGGAVAAVIVGWRIAKRLRVSVSAVQTSRDDESGDKRLAGEGSQKISNDLLASMDTSLKTLVQGQQEAFKKLDRIQEAAESVRREIAEVKGSLFGRG